VIAATEQGPPNPPPALIASQLAGHDVTIQTLPQAVFLQDVIAQGFADPTSIGAYAYVGGDLIVMPLSNYAALEQHTEPAIAGAAAELLAHEAAHTSGILDELAADQRAYHTAHQVLRLLGWHGARYYQACGEADYQALHSHHAP
jgi:hypothetical protein